MMVLNLVLFWSPALMVVLGRNGDFCGGVWLEELVFGGLFGGVVVVLEPFLSLFTAMKTLAQATPICSLP